MLNRLVCVLAFLTFTTNAYSAEVIKINEKTQAIFINEGESTGFTKGSKVCFFDGEKKVSCGKVMKAVKKKAIAKVPKTKFSIIHTGFTVTLLDSQQPVSKPMESAASEGSEHKVSIALNVHLMPLTPATYNNIDFLAPTTGSSTLWESSSTTQSILVPPGFGLEVELLRTGLVAGFRFGLYPSASQPNQYDSTQTNLSLTSDITATEIGAYIDYIYLRRWSLNFGLGIDFDMTKVTFSGTETDENDGSVNTEVYSATSSLNVISLRLPVTYKYSFGHFGIAGTLALLLPLYAMGPTASVTTPTTPTSLRLAEPNYTSIVSDQDADLKDSLAHKKASFAVDFALGIFYQF